MASLKITVDSTVVDEICADIKPFAENPHTLPNHIRRELAAFMADVKGSKKLDDWFDIVGDGGHLEVVATARMSALLAGLRSRAQAVEA